MTSGQLLEQRARELLADELRAAGFEREASRVLVLDFHRTNTFSVAMRAIAKALTPLPGDDLELRERKLIVDWLRSQSEAWKRTDPIDPRWLECDRLAYTIERGEHAITSSRVIGGEQKEGMGDGLRPQPAGQATPGAAEASPPFGDHQAQEGGS